MCSKNFHFWSCPYRRPVRRTAQLSWLRRVAQLEGYFEEQRSSHLPRKVSTSEILLTKNSTTRRALSNNSTTRCSLSKITTTHSSLFPGSTTRDALKNSNTTRNISLQFFTNVNDSNSTTKRLNTQIRLGPPIKSF